MNVAATAVAANETVIAQFFQAKKKIEFFLIGEHFSLQPSWTFFLAIYLFVCAFKPTVIQYFEKRKKQQKSLNRIRKEIEKTQKPTNKQKE